MFWIITPQVNFAVQSRYVGRQNGIERRGIIGYAQRLWSTASASETSSGGGDSSCLMLQGSNAHVRVRGIQSCMYDKTYEALYTTISRTKYGMVPRIVCKNTARETGGASSNILMYVAEHVV